MKELGYVVWGVRSGFKNNWLVSNVDNSVLSALTDEMRIYCHGTVTEFFSIEKVGGFTVLTIYNPNTSDHVGRRAYIAISIVLSKSYGLSGNIVRCLQEMMSTYSSKQGKALVNKISISDFEPILAKISSTPKGTVTPGNSKKIGILKSQDLDSFNTHFKDLTINGFRKVYFLKEPISALEQKDGVELIRDFKKSSRFSLKGYDPRYHDITINDKRIEISQHVIFEGDIVKITHKTQKITRKIVTSGNNVTRTISDLFPENKSERKVSKPVKKTWNKILVIGSLILLVGFGIALSFLKFSGTSGSSGTSNMLDTQPKASYNMKDNVLEISGNPPELSKDSTKIRLKNEAKIIGKFIGKSYKDTVQLDVSKVKFLILSTMDDKDSRELKINFIDAGKGLNQDEFVTDAEGDKSKTGGLGNPSSNGSNDESENQGTTHTQVTPSDHGDQGDAGGAGDGDGDKAKNSFEAKKQELLNHCDELLSRELPNDECRRQIEFARMAIIKEKDNFKNLKTQEKEIKAIESNL